MGKKKEYSYIIEPDTPSTRCMDKTPNTLGKDLGMTANTVRNRLALVGDCFDLTKRDKSCERCPYQVYNYEGIPILSAYLKRIGSIEDIKGDSPRKKFKKCNANDMESFMLSLEAYLTEHPEQSYCRKFLYAQDQFQHYWIETHLQNLIEERLRCIEMLSHQITLEPTYPKEVLESQTSYPLYFPALLPNIIKSLDRIIFELANYADLDRVKETDAYSTEHGLPQKLFNSNKYGSVDSLVKEWYCSLQNKRESITENFQILLEGLPNKSSAAIADALNKRLIDETLSEEQSRINAMEQVMEQTWELLEFSRQMEGYGKERLQAEIFNVMQLRSTTYLKAIFKSEPVPILDFPFACNFPPVILELLEEWFNLGISVTSGLRTILQNSYHQKGDRKYIQVFWDTMMESNYIPETQRKESVVSAAVKGALVTAEYFPISRIEKPLNDFLLNPLNIIDNPTVIRFGGAVTLEFFWQKHAESWSQYYANVYEQYLEALRKIRTHREAGR